MKKIITFLLFSLSIYNYCFSQKKITYNVINNFREQYIIDVDSLDCYNNNKFKNSTLPPTYLNSNDIRENFKCLRKFSIPDSLLAELYPFNVDSIVVFYPTKYCDSFDYKKLATMNGTDIDKLTDLLYNYDFYESNKETFTIQNITEYKRADIRLFFYNNTSIDTLSLYFDDAPQIRFESTFEDIYWGESCDDLYDRLILFFNKQYGYQIEKCIEKEDKIEVIPLIKKQ